MKKLLFLIVAAMFAATSFPACSDDDKDKDKDDSAQLVGTWETVHYSDKDDSFDVSQSSMAWHVVTFRADGTFLFQDYYNSPSTGTYSIEGNTLTLIYQDELDPAVMTIKTLNSTTLVIESADVYDGYVYTYKRI